MINKLKIAVFASLFGLVFICSSCGGNPKVEKTKPEVVKENQENEFAAQMSLPDACSFISIEELKVIVGDAVDEVQIKDATNSQSKHARSCFFKWEHEGMPNSGLMAQVQSNPIPDEFPTWPKVFIESKKSTGEKTLAAGGGELSYTYENFPIGLDGAYNFELGKYFWRLDDDLVYMLAFNLPVEEETLTDWATKIATKISARAK